MPLEHRQGTVAAPIGSAEEPGRRAWLQLGIATLLSTATGQAWGSSPLQEPMTLEGRVRSSRLIFTGRLSRVVFLSGKVTRQLYAAGQTIDPEDLRLYERHQLSELGEGFVEVENAVPRFLGSDVSGSEERSLETGLVYYRQFVDLNPNIKSYLSELLGSEVILFWGETSRHLGPMRTRMPFPIYHSPRGHTWQDSRPLPISELPLIGEIAKKFSFREPIARTTK